jgi:hypothetical protein
MTLRAFLKRKEAEQDQWRLWDVRICWSGDTFWAGTVIETTEANARKAASLEFPLQAADSIIVNRSSTASNSVASFTVSVTILSDGKQKTAEGQV